MSDLKASMDALMASIKNAPKPTRFDWQKSIANNITLFNPDAVEAMELLDALTASLADRYHRGELTDVEHEAKQLREALDELDRTTASISKEDYLYDSNWCSDNE